LRSTQGTRLLGHVEIARGEALASIEQKKCMSYNLQRPLAENYYLALALQLNKVNFDGPSLELKAGFSVSESNTESSVFSGTRRPIQREPKSIYSR
jgi:uncharacterized iron-regulated membrane protein